MAVLSDLAMFGRLARSLPAFVRPEPPTVEEARAEVRERLERRGEVFLDVVERCIYDHPGSPYLPLLRGARCELGDLKAMVPDKGVEGTLQSLRDNGVYVTFQEFKGREPMERNGVATTLDPSAFKNPLSQKHLMSRTGGSTGAPTETPSDLRRLSAGIAHGILTLAVHGLEDAPVGIWRCAPPIGPGLNQILRGILHRNPVRKWFYPMGPENVRVDMRYRLGTALVIWECRALGYHVPTPEFVPFDRAEVIARWCADTVDKEGRLVFRAGVSMLLRVALAAVESGISLEGVTFIGGGEPPTPAKVNGLLSSGAHYIPQYAGADIGGVGWGCANPTDQCDVHFFEDHLAMLQVPQQVPSTDQMVNAFCYTSLSDAASRVLLNVEVDDFGVVEERSCGCMFEEIGFKKHVREIRSYRKLTGEGITLVDGDMVRVLEEVLPGRFGGSPQDYQLHEQEDPDGFTRLILVVDPAVDLQSEGDVIDTVLETLGKGSLYEDSAREHWDQARSFRIERRKPEWTGRGKFPPLVVHRV